MDLLEWLRQFAQELYQGLGADPLWTVAVFMAAAITVVWFTGVLRVRHYTHRLLYVLDESTPERMRITPTWNGFRADILNPILPYQTLTVLYVAPLPLDLMAMAAAIFGHSGGRLTIQARFRTPLRAELAWVRGGLPAQALRKESDISAWIHRKLAITSSEYATRGNRVEPLAAAFTEIYIRFHTSIQRVCIQQELDVPLEIVVAMSDLPPAALPHLLASAWSLSQAATHG